MRTSEHVHVARGTVAGGVVERALRAANRDDAVVALRDAYDADILMHCRRRFTSLSRVIARISTTFPVGDEVIGWRIRTLVGEGVLEARGTGAYGFAEIRAAVR